MSQPPPSIEGFWARTERKFKENPFVPLGLGVATFGLWRMFTTLHRRDSTGFQNAQRIRVGGQLASVVFLVGGLYWAQRSQSIKNQ